MVRTPYDSVSRHHLLSLSFKRLYHTSLLATPQSHRICSCLRSLPMLFSLPGMLFSKVSARFATSSPSDIYPMSASKLGPPCTFVHVVPCISTEDTCPLCSRSSQWLSYDQHLCMLMEETSLLTPFCQSSPHFYSPISQSYYENQTQLYQW